jgi:hypothetical protein
MTQSEKLAGHAVDPRQLESIAGGDCTASQLVALTGSLKQAYENLVDFTSHVIERVASK